MNPARPCHECPFSRAVTPGALGQQPGASVEEQVKKFVGQSVGPFVLPCHCAKGYDPHAGGANMERPQCAGAAIFRSNIGATDFLPRVLYSLPRDTRRVFSNIQQFVAHHLGVSERSAVVWLRKNSPGDLRKAELDRLNTSPTSFIKLVPKE